VKYIRTIILTLILAESALAHEFSTSYASYRVEGPQVHVEFILSLADLHTGPPIDKNGDYIFSEEEVGGSIDAIYSAIQSNYKVEAPDPPVSMMLEKHNLTPDGVLRFYLLYTFSHDVTDLKVTSSLDTFTQTNHRHLIQIGDGDNLRQGVIDANDPSIEIDVDGPTFFETIWDFLELGVEHIVTGYDHLAFLMGLLIGTTTFISLVKVVTAFTAAHSVTLALATFNVVSMPPRLIESLIALSIAYVAIENFMGRNLVHRWKVTFLFGLVHGFGFSNVLREMELSPRNLAISLFSFNAGVEIGQLLFVAFVFPLIYLAIRSRWKEHFLSATSLLIMSLGFYWFVQRAFFT
jgi:hypothetical protein